MSYVAQSGMHRVEQTAAGNVMVIPVRVNVNLKAERLEQLEGRSSRREEEVDPLGRVWIPRDWVAAEATGGGAGWRRTGAAEEGQGVAGASLEEGAQRRGLHSCAEGKGGCCACAAACTRGTDYSDDAVYRSLVSESLEAARMAQSALLWWLRDEGHNIHLIERFSLLEFQRFFESFLRLRHSRSAADDSGGGAAAVDLCRGRNLLRIEANERDDNAEARLISLDAGGGSAEDVRLLVAAGADVAAVAEEGRSALYWAARQGHVEVIEARARAGADIQRLSSCCFALLLMSTRQGRMMVPPLWMQQAKTDIQMLSMLCFALVLIPIKQRQILAPPCSWCQQGKDEWWHHTCVDRKPKWAFKCCWCFASCCCWYQQGKYVRLCHVSVYGRLAGWFK
jgi:hypothetical protein